MTKTAKTFKIDTESTELVPAASLRVGDLIAGHERGRGYFFDFAGFVPVTSVSRNPEKRNELIVSCSGKSGFRTNKATRYARLVG